MHIRFYRDPDTGEPHIFNHGITEAEVSRVLHRPGEDLSAADGARMALGQTAAGRYLRVIYVPDPEPDSVFVVMAYELGKAADRILLPPKEETPMNEEKFPPDWDAERVRRLIANYDALDEEQQVAEDEAAQEQPSQTTVVVPIEFMPAIRQMFAHKGGS